MPREGLKISKFGGVIGMMDSKDVPINKAIYSKNVDPHTFNGKLRANKVYSAQSNTTGVTRGAWIDKDGATKYFVWSDGSNYYATTNLASSLITLEASADGPSDIYVYNNFAIMPRSGFFGKWVGFAGYPFGMRGLRDIVWSSAGIDVLIARADYGGSYSDYRIQVEVTSSSYPLDGFGWKWRESTDGGSTYGAWSSEAAATYPSQSWHSVGSYGDVEIHWLQDDVTTSTFFTIFLEPDAEITIEDNNIKNRLDSSGTDGFFKFESYTWGGSGSSFTSGDLVRYALSFVYDESQESVLAFDSRQTCPGTGQNCTIRVTAVGARDNPEAFNRRVTSIRLYRTDDTGSGEGSFRFVDEVRVDNNSNGGEALWEQSGAASDNYHYDFVDDGTIGATYEALTGVTDSFETTYFKYDYGCILNGYAFATGITALDGLVEPYNKVIRSKSNQPEVFDWTVDICDLTFAPKAIEAYNGRIYIFGENEYARLNPDGMYVEDIFEGFGIYEERALMICDYGMFWCNEKGAYWQQGNNFPQKISLPINEALSTSYAKWSDIFDSNTIINIGYCKEKESVLFVDVYGETGGGNPYLPCWAFYLPTQEWYYWEISVPASGRSDSSIIADRDGTLHHTIGGANAARSKLFDGTNYEAFEWWSNEIDYGTPSQQKKVYKVVTSGTGSPTTTVYKDGNIGSAITPGASGDISSSNWKQDTTIVKLSGATGSTLREVEDVEIVFRRMVGWR